jgi:hypothetical protein
MNDNARKLYDALSEEYDLGTFEQFSSDIQDENKRRKLYDATIQEYDFGEYDSFSKQLGFGGESIATIQPKAEEVKPVVSPVYSEEQQDSVWRTYKDVGAVKPAVQSGEKETLTTFGEGVKQGADAIYQGNKYFAGEQARFWNGAQQDAKKALEFLDAQGEGFDAKGWDVRKAMDEAAQKQWEKDYEEFLKVKEARRKERKESDMGLWERILHKVADPSMPEPLESRRINPTNMSYQRPLLTLNDALKEADGDVAKARAILEKQKAEGITRKLVAFELVDRGIPRHGYKLVNAEGEEIGEVTSGTMSPTRKIGIGMGYVAKAYTAIDSEIFIDVRGRKLKAKVVKAPFRK